MVQWGLIPAMVAGVFSISAGGATLAQQQAPPQDFAALAKASYDAGKLPEASDLLEQASAKPPELAYALGGAFYQGKGADKDCDRAYGNLKIAADGGYGPAMKSLGDYYLNGCGRVQNFNLASLYYELARKKGEPGAKEGLAAAKREQERADKAADPIKRAYDDDEDRMRRTGQMLNDLSNKAVSQGIAKR